MLMCCIVLHFLIYITLLIAVAIQQCQSVRTPRVEKSFEEGKDVERDPEGMVTCREERRVFREE